MSNDGDGVKAATYHSSYVEIRFKDQRLQKIMHFLRPGPPIWATIGLCLIIFRFHDILSALLCEGLS
jgi:hypothetical protein